MSASESPPTVREVFDRAFELEPELREAYLVRVCDGHPTVLDEVRELFAELDELDDDFLVPASDVEGLHYQLLGSGAQLDQTLLGKPPAAPDYVGHVIDDRYTIEELVGTGSFGAVYRASDRLYPDAVAIKLVLRRPSRRPELRHRELSALRLIDVPGVIQVLDVGEYEGHDFFVTEFFPGSRFPGGARGDWDRVRGPAVALLEAVARLHAQGVVHGDLKPGNVLVNEHGGVGVLDFGIAGGPGLASRGGDDGPRLGTLAYTAPEQLREPPAPASAATDLYAAALMVYEALTGAVAHVSSDAATFMARRATDPVDASALDGRGLPDDVRAALLAALSPDPTERPAGVEELLWTLRGRTGGASVLAFEFARARLECVLRELDAADGELDLVGPRGAGKQLLLEFVVGVLEGAGAQVRSDLASRDCGLDSAGSWDGRIVAVGLLPAAEQHRGDVEAGRPPADLYVGTRRAAETRGHVVTRFTHDELMERFQGPDRVLHLREDGASELLRRTGGWLGLVVLELDAWLGAGLAREEDGLVAIERHAIDRLAFSGPVAQVPLLRDPEALEEADLRLLDALVRLSPGCMTGELAAALGEPPAEVASRVRSLVARGHVAEGPDDLLVPLMEPGPVEIPVLLERLLEVVGEEDDRRIVVVLGSEDRHRAVDELLAAAAHLFDLRRRTAAFECARRALQIAEALREETLLRAAVRRLALVASATHDGRTVELALHHLERLGRDDFEEYHELLVARSRLGLFGSDAQPRSLDPTTWTRDPELQRAWLAKFWHMRRSSSVADRQLYLRWVRPFFDSPHGERWQSQWWLFGGFEAYYRQDFITAAARFDRASRTAHTESDFLLAEQGACMVLTWTDEVESALQRTEALRHRAARLRTIYMELYASMLKRQVLHRLGRAGSVDHELLRIARGFGPRRVWAELAMWEAALAWRSGDGRASRELASRAARALEAGGAADPTAVAWCTARQSGPLGHRADSELVELAHACRVPGGRLQSVALLAMAGVELPSDVVRAALACVDELEPGPRHLRREVLSAEECVRALTG